MDTSSLEITNGTAQLSGDLTFATVTNLYDRMRSLTSGDGMPRSIDLAKVGRIDSAGLALLLEWQSAYRKQAGSSDLIKIGNAPPALLKIARLCDASEFLSDDRDATEEQ